MSRTLTYPDLHSAAEVFRWLQTLDLDPEDLEGKNAAQRLALAEEIVNNCIILEELLALDEDADEQGGIVELPTYEEFAMAANPVETPPLRKSWTKPRCPAPPPAQIHGREEWTSLRQRRVKCMYREGVEERQRNNWHDWYEDVPGTVERILARYDIPDYTGLYIKLIAVTSPRMPVARNVKVASQVLAQYVRNREITRFGIPNSERAVANMLSIGPYTEDPLAGVSGEKVEPFARALLGDPDAVAVDIWMMRAFSCADKHHQSPSTFERKLITAKTMRLARHMGTTARDYQADAWVGVKTLEGLRRRNGTLAHRADPISFIIKVILPAVLDAPQPAVQMTFKDLDSNAAWDK